jgi:Mrp family chromosome partitioning ATPase
LARLSAGPSGGQGGQANGLKSTEANGVTRALWPYFEAVRDRLVFYFETRRVHHKPKLIAITSPERGAGGSTIAAGLAAVLSDCGDANVLLVDMKNEDFAEARPLLEGHRSLPLGEALKNSRGAEGGNLALATITAHGESVRRFIPKKFYDMIPEFRASRYDYIIFDMPPLSQTSVTLPMVGFMDKVLLVVEAEKTDSEVIRRMVTELEEVKAKVSVVFNKGRSYVPTWLKWWGACPRQNPKQSPISSETQAFPPGRRPQK